MLTCASRQPHTLKPQGSNRAVRHVRSLTPPPLPRCQPDPQDNAIRDCLSLPFPQPAVEFMGSGQEMSAPAKRGSQTHSCPMRASMTVSDGYISWLRDKLEGQVNAEIGKGSFWIFQEFGQIPTGANWTSALEEALAGARFLIPVLSPSYFASQPCLFELAKFHGFESSSGRKDLIIPIHFREAPDYWDDPNNPHAQLLRERQVFDWRRIRRKRRDDPEVLESIRTPSC